jgi:hypothetical protein
MEKYVKNLAGRPEEERPLGWPWRRWEGNIKMDLKAIEREAMVRINLAWGRDR